ncbi:MAG: tetratricopeptide repeat protein [Phycisphaerae bacterium]
MKTSHFLAAAVLSLAMLLSRPAAGLADDPAPTPKVVVVPGPGMAPATSSAPATKPAPTTAKADTLDACHDLYAKGDYSAAVDGYKKLAAKSPLGAAIGMAEALAIEGKYKEAIEALKAVEGEGAKDAAWHVLMYELTSAVGKYDEALDHATKAHEMKPDWAPAIFAHGQALEVVGRKEEAKAVYKSIDKVIRTDAYRRDPRSLVALGQIMDRDVVLGGKKASNQAENILQNYLQEAYMNVDKKYWPANVAAGMYLLSNHRPNQAIAEFKLAEALNKKIPDVFVGYGVAALSQFQFEAVLKLSDQALAINPNHVEAMLLKATCMMQWRKFDEVEGVLKKALEVNPNHLEALSLMAALHTRLGHGDKAKPYIEAVHKINRNYAGLYTAIGDWLVAGRQFKQAEPNYIKATELAPELAEPWAGLGLMYMQTGDEAKASVALKKAHDIDDFREDVVNYYNLVEKILDPAKYAVKETEHFIVKVDTERDSVLLDQVSDYMESIYKEICGDYDYELKDKTLIEIFPSGPQFSVRVSGKGWVPTVGASTGNVIALAAPGKDVANSMTYNWSVVLRHEYTHSVTLAATQNRIPHWFTEACAVSQQPDKTAYNYVRLLVQAVRTNTLIPVKDLDWGFIRPKTPAQRQQAYAQSEWILEYINVKKGYHPTVANMLKAFNAGKTQAEVIKDIFGTTEEQFDKDFAEWAKAWVKDEWHFDPNPPPDAQKAVAEADARPNDAAALSEAAIALASIGQLPRAQQYAQKALDIDPNSTKALAAMASALAAAKKNDEAIGMAKRLEDLDHSSIYAPRVMAQCYMEKRSWAETILALETYKQRQPLDPYSYENLARIYKELGQPAKALPNLLELHRRTMNKPDYARQIADIYRSLNQDDEALRFYRETLYIDPYETSTYEAMASINLRKAAKSETPADKDKYFKEALRQADHINMVDPELADSWNKTAMVQYKIGKATGDKKLLEKARESAKKSIEKDAEGQGKQILEMIEEALKG